MDVPALCVKRAIGGLYLHRSAFLIRLSSFTAVSPETLTGLVYTNIERINVVRTGGVTSAAVGFITLAGIEPELVALRH